MRTVFMTAVIFYFIMSKNYILDKVASHPQYAELNNIQK